jgi:hypothetical protein
VFATRYDIKVTSDTPVAEGTFVTFVTTLLFDGRPAEQNDYQFRWKFDGIERVRKMRKLSSKIFNQFLTFAFRQSNQKIRA